jgi:hypothetical protein
MSGDSKIEVSVHRFASPTQTSLTRIEEVLDKEMEEAIPG